MRMIGPITTLGMGGVFGGLARSGAAAGTLGRGATFTRYLEGGGGVIAELGEGGMLDLAIQRAPGTPSGGQMFNEAASAFGDNLVGIRGTWLGTGEMTSNYDAFQAALAAGASPEQAALQTFTGTMAARNGFTAVNVVTNSVGKVVVEFTKP
jgi:filamentous hemagglutinin